MTPINPSDMLQDSFDQNPFSPSGGDEIPLSPETIALLTTLLNDQPSVHPDEVGASQEFVAAAATSSGARPPSLQPNNDSTSRRPHVPRSDAGRKKSDRIDQRRNKRPRHRPQKDIVLRSQRLHRLQPRFLDRGKKDAMAAASKEIDTAAPGVHLRSSPLGVLDLKRYRSQNWSPEEKARFLGLKEEAVWAVEGKGWDHISKGMMECGFARTPKNCENQWGTLLKSYRANGEHESSTGTDTRSRNKLPPELYEGMERILLAQEAKRSKRKSRGIAVPESRGDEDDDLYTNSGLLQPGEAPERGVTDCAETPCLESSDREGSRAILEEAPHLVIDAHASPSIDASPSIKLMIKAAVDSKLEMLHRSCSTPEQKVQLTDVAPHVTQVVKVAIELEHGESSPSRTGLADVMERLVNDTLEASFQPLVSALQASARWEEEDRKRLQVIADKRRDLDLEEEQIKLRLPGRHRRSPKGRVKAARTSREEVLSGRVCRRM
jgi:hypothetical protein